MVFDDQLDVYSDDSGLHDTVGGVIGELKKLRFKVLEDSSEAN